MKSIAFPLIGALLSLSVGAQIPSVKFGVTHKPANHTVPKACFKLDNERFLSFSVTGSPDNERGPRYLQEYSCSSYDLLRQRALTVSGMKGALVMEVVKYQDRFWGLIQLLEKKQRQLWLGEINVKTGVVKPVTQLQKQHSSPSIFLDEVRLQAKGDYMLVYRLCLEENQKGRVEISWLEDGGTIGAFSQVEFDTQGEKMLQESDRWVNKPPKSQIGQLQVEINAQGEVFSLLSLDGPLDEKYIPQKRKLMMIILKAASEGYALEVSPEDGIVTSAHMALDPTGNPWVAGFISESVSGSAIVGSYFWLQLDAAEKRLKSSGVQAIKGENRTSVVRNSTFHNNYRIVSLEFSQNCAFVVSEVQHEGGFGSYLLPSKVFWKQVTAVLSGNIVVGPALVVGFDLQSGDLLWEEKWNRWELTDYNTRFRSGIIAQATDWGVVLLSSVAITEKQNKANFNPSKVLMGTQNGGTFALEVTDKGIERKDLLFKNKERFVPFRVAGISLYYIEVLLFGEKDYNRQRWCELTY